MLYGPEIKGPLLWKWQLLGAWQSRSLSNWSGQAWGGGRFGVMNEWFSGEFSE